MTVIRLASQGETPGGALKVRVSFGDDAEYDVLVTDPATEAEEQNLAWYFQDHLRYPFLDTDQEQHAVKQVTAYGESLFHQVFGGEANHDYRVLRERAFDGCRLEMSGPSPLHRLHWEAMRDPDLDRPLSLRMPFSRRVSAQPSRFALPDPRPTLNILVVVARPGGAHDIGYRTISRPLLDALRTARLPVTVDLVRPGTWEALRTHLRMAAERHGSGWYHVIHFDLHGAFTDYDPLNSEGLPISPPGSGTSKQGVLFFETQHDGLARPVSAQSVASLLAEHRIPIAVLNACQSAMQSVSEAGLAQHLAEAGVPVTVGMAYSVTVSAAVRAMPVLYGRLADGADPVRAAHAARQELAEHPARQAYFDQQIDLEDWLLPVVFGQRPLQLKLRDMTKTELARFYERAASVGDEPPTEYGFVGRDLDIQAIERRLLAGPNSNELLVQGMAGAGKSTLLAHLAWWWQRTGLAESPPLWFSYEQRSWTAGQIVREVRSTLFTAAEHAHADLMPEAAQLEHVAARLRSEHHLLILDNAESITATPAAIPHALSAREQDKLKTLLSRLRGGRTLVLLGSREREAWLTSDATGPAVYPLSGLDPQAASLLVHRILARHNATRFLDDEAERQSLEDLVILLSGYPLPLTVVLSALEASPPSKVRAELQEGSAGADPTGLIHQAIEYSHGKLDPVLQNSLSLLAPFTGVIPVGPALERYQALLREDEAIQELATIDLIAALNQAQNVGLATPHQELGHLIQIQPVLPYFLRSRLHERPAVRAAADQAHYRLYDERARELGDLLGSGDDPRQRADGFATTKVEYPNLTAALSHALRTGQPVVPVIAALDEYLDQAGQQDSRRRLLEESLAKYPDPRTPDHLRELAHLHDLAGHTALTQHRFNEAKSHYEAELKLMQALGERNAQAVTYGQLGLVAMTERRFTDAEKSYHLALEICLESGDEYGVASIHHNLGVLAQKQQRMDEAQTSYRKALDVFQHLGDQHSIATAYDQLARVAQQQGRFADAADNYRKALNIYVRFSDQHGVGQNYCNLGVLAQQQQLVEDAEASYRNALDIFLNLDDQHSAALPFHNLGVLAYQQRRFAEAERNYRKALNIYLEFNDQHMAAGTYHQLGMVAQAQREWAEAEENFRKAFNIFRESDPPSMLIPANQLGISLAQLGRHQDAAAMLLYAATTWRRESGGWPPISLEWLNRERAAVRPAQFAALVTEHVPAELAEELITVLDIFAIVDDTEDGDESGIDQHPDNDGESFP